MPSAACEKNHFRFLVGRGFGRSAARNRRAGATSPYLIRYRQMVRVLFVCMGNICRSPIAQGVFENVLRREGVEGEVSVDSAGTGRWHVGSPPDERALSAASIRGLDISAQRARQVRPEDCENFDYILMMDEE